MTLYYIKGGKMPWHTCVLQKIF